MLPLGCGEGNWGWNDDVCLPLTAPGSSAAADLGSEGRRGER